MFEEVEQPTLEHMRKLADEYIDSYFRMCEHMPYTTKSLMRDAYCAGYRLGFMNAEKAAEKNCGPR